MPYLRLQIGETLQQQWEVVADRTTIGRAGENDIVLPGGGVSKRHAVIERQGQAFVLLDHGSANGVYVNGKRVQRHILKYWDEIQIFNHVLKFMAVAKLPGEQEGSVFKGAPLTRHDATMEIDIASLGDLAALRNKMRVAYLVRQDAAQPGSKLRLDKVNVSIGKGIDCDVRLEGWFAPRLAAVIQRRNDGFYLMPKRRGRVSLNANPVKAPVKLKDADRLLVRRLPLTFRLRPMDDA